jgi:hypothetical protein
MTRSIPVWTLAIFLIAGLPTGHAANAPACTALTAQDAAAHLGVPLPENFKTDSPATAENGHDNTSACGWFPQGYSLATANAPPDHGILITVHTFGTPDEAATFHGYAREMAEESAKRTSPDARLARMDGLGESAFVDQKQFSGVNIATARFAKGTHAVQIQVWTKDGSAGAAATSAAKQAAARL